MRRASFFSIHNAIYENKETLFYKIYFSSFFIKQLLRIKKEIFRPYDIYVCVAHYNNINLRQNDRKKLILIPMIN